jgi:hypothetical protein
VTQNPIPSSDDLRAQIRGWDPALDETSDEFEAAFVMLAALYFGTGHGTGRKLSEFTGVAYERVLEFRRRLSDAGIWQDGRTVAEWDKPRGGEVTFWIDVGVACGLFEMRTKRMRENP